MLFLLAVLIAVAAVVMQVCYAARMLDSTSSFASSVYVATILQPSVSGILGLLVLGVIVFTLIIASALQENLLTDQILTIDAEKYLLMNKSVHRAMLVLLLSLVITFIWLAVFVAIQVT
jgi:hypothetical protein